MFFEDPLLVQKVGLFLVKSAEEKDLKQGREKQSYAVETFSKLLELVTIRHRLLESASETAHLAQLRYNSHWWGRQEGSSACVCMLFILFIYFLTLSVYYYYQDNIFFC